MKLFEKHVGSMIRLNRIHQNISIRGLAEIVGIEYSQLSKIERGMESANVITIESIFEALDLDYYQIMAYSSQCKDKIDQIYFDIVYYKDEEYIHSQINKLNKNAYTMGLTIPLLLINLIFNILRKQPCHYDRLILILSKVEDTMTLLEKQLFKQYQGFYLFTKGDFVEAIKKLEEAETFYMDNKTQAMLLYQKGYIYVKHKDYLEAFECLKNAKLYFEQHHNYIRSAFCSVRIASIYLMMGNYSKAYTMYKEMIEVYYSLRLKAEDRLILCRNLLYLCILMEKYDEFFLVASSFDEEVKKLLKNEARYFYYQIIASYHQKDYFLCKQAIDQFDIVNKNPFDQYMVTYYRLKVGGATSKDIVEMLQNGLMALEKTVCDTSNRTILKLLLKEYQDSKDYETLYHYALKLSQYS